ncbi:transporter substrate-binding domain-containing protein [Phaeovulum sp. NW3]|uniref:transporter substrate-binding domain-containing protein n=1 Tax=Phaeovulum sp. NW3 TaxID=2934933 RepID=UPI0020217C6A|nr:transporter substrate-binding domain-containing protein [Phaeovulum sp. NW3]MCL7464612.1 transporter substrate-binding domain-containing protein [Phaeovulum sp. NW3]
MLPSIAVTFRGVAAASIAVVLTASTALAGPLLDRIEAGEPIRIGFANEAPFAYPGDDGAPMGFVNAYALELLAEMGHDNIEVVVTDWGGLIPALNAGRVDIVTGGLNILKSRCDSIAFSEPMLMAGDAFIVPTGNPKGLNTYEDLAQKDAMLVTGAGYSNIEAARNAGVADGKIMQVPGPSEILAAVVAGRGDAGGLAHFTAITMAGEHDGVDVSDVTQMPETTMNWASIGFRKTDQDFVEQFNAAQQDYLGSDKMMATVAQYGYGPEHLPTGQTAAWVCENR